MTIFLKLSVLALLMFTSSCDSVKSTADAENSSTKEETKKEAPNVMNEKLINEGYSVGTITYLANSKCSYIIIDEKTGVKFDPINIDEDKFKAYKKDASKIYYKYRGLRMMNRCNEGQPIQLEAIQSR